jgi:hypothetical protein
MGQHDQDSRDGSLRRIVVVCGAAVLAVVGGGLGGYGSHVLADPGRESVAAEATEPPDALRQEREKSQQLERQLAAVLKHAAERADLAAQVASQNQELADLHKALDEERARAEATAADPEVLQQERARAAGLARDLAAARSEIEAQSAAIAHAREQAIEAQKTADRSVAELRAQITEGAARVDGMTRDLAAMQEENGRLSAGLKAAAAIKVADASRLEELQQALRQAHAERSPVARPLPVQAAASKPQFAAVEAVAMRQPPVAPARPDPATPATLRLMARAQQLVEQRNISGARQILERAGESGHPTAAFALAETYDPNMLAAWGTVGTQGDVGRARALYGKALAGGVVEADTRLKALP